MRQWACVAALLLGLAGNGYATSIRIRMPIAIERRLDPELGPAARGRGRRTVQTLDWWRA